MKQFYLAIVATCLGLSAVAAPLQINRTQLRQLGPVQKEARTLEMTSKISKMVKIQKLDSPTRAGEAASSLEGDWTFFLGDYYFQTSTNNTIQVVYEATVDGNLVIFEDPTGYELPMIGNYDSSKSTITFTRMSLGTTSGYYVYQEPFVYNYSTNDLDLQDIVGKYNASEGSISFDPDNGISWPAYTNSTGTSLAGYFSIYDLESAIKGEKKEEPIYDEEQKGQWVPVGKATFVDAWILPSYSMSGVQINPNDYAYEVELQQNVNDENLYRLWKPYKSAGCLLYEQGLNQSPYDGQIQFNVSDPKHIEIVPCGLPSGFKNNNGEFFLTNELGWYIAQGYDKSEIISLLYGDDPGDIFENGVITIKDPIFDFEPEYTNGYTWKENPYYSLISSDIWKEGLEPQIHYSYNADKTATVTGCDNNMTFLNIPNTVEYEGVTYTVTAIAERAFQTNQTITSLNLPKSIKTIGSQAFSSVPNLREINIEDLASFCNISFSNNSTNPIYNCFPGNDPENWGMVTFGGKALTELEIPEGVTSNLSYTFYQFKSLEKVTLPSTMTTIGGYAFRENTSLTTVTLNSDITSIGMYAFYNCKSLKDFVLPSSLTTLGSNTFYGCTHAFTEIVLPEGVTSIPTSCFEGCEDVTEITIGPAVSSISSYAFNIAGIETVTSYAETAPKCSSTYVFPTAVYSTATLYVPEGTLEDYASATAWKNFLNIKEMKSTSVESIDKDTLEVEYFDLMGRRIANPSNGQLVIRKQGNTVSKIIVK